MVNGSQKRRPFWFGARNMRKGMSIGTLTTQYIGDSESAVHWYISWLVYSPLSYICSCLFVLLLFLIILLKWNFFCVCVKVKKCIEVTLKSIKKKNIEKLCWFNCVGCFTVSECLCYTISTGFSITFCKSYKYK